MGIRGLTGYVSQQSSLGEDKSWPLASPTSVDPPSPRQQGKIKAILDGWSFVYYVAKNISWNYCGM